MSSIEIKSIFNIDKDGAYCFLVRIDTTLILLECGWSYTCSEYFDQYLEPYINDIKAVLISHPTLEYSGGIPYLYQNTDFSGRIYMTFPVHKLSQMVLYDICQALPHSQFSIESINNIWQKIIPLKHSQKIHYKDCGIVIVSHRAGHTVGGSAWKITHNMQEIVYAGTFSPHAYRHLMSFDYQSLVRPSLLIMDAKHSHMNIDPESQELFDAIRDTLKKNKGTVLIPVSTAGITLEILLALEQYWELYCDKMQRFPVVFAGFVANSTIEFAKSYLEWMSEEILSRFEGSRDNPFTFRYVKLATSIEDIPEGPKCIVATSEDCGYGISQYLLCQIINDPNSLLLLVQNPPVNSVLFEAFYAQQGAEMSFNIPNYVFQEASNITVDLIEPSTDTGESAIGDKIPEKLEPMLFEQSPFLAYSPYDIKSHADEYGEECILLTGQVNFKLLEQSHLQTEEFEFWPQNELGNAEIKTGGTVLKSYTQTLAQKMIEMQKLRINAQYYEEQFTKTIQCKRQQVTFDFRADATSIKMSLVKIRPKRLIYVNTYEDQALNLVKYAESQLEIKDIYILQDQPIELPASHSVYPIKLSEETYTSLKFIPVDDYELAYINGVVEQENEQLVFKPSQNIDKNQYNLFLGYSDILILKRDLHNLGLSVQFCEQKLIVNDKVFVSHRNNQWTLEGVVSDEYFKVRKLLYSYHKYIQKMDTQFSIVAHVYQDDVPFLLRVIKAVQKDSLTPIMCELYFLQNINWRDIQQILLAVYGEIREIPKVIFTFPQIVTPKEVQLLNVYEYPNGPSPSMKRDLNAIVLDFEYQAINQEVPPNIQFEQQDCVVIGGTFDYIHQGHLLLLTIAALVTRQKLTIGITHQALLEHKKFKELIMNFDQRSKFTGDVINIINSQVALDIYAIQEKMGPAGWQEELSLIVVSKEVEAVVPEINQHRKDKGLSELQIISVELLQGSQAKISSSDLRLAIANQNGLFVLNRWKQLCQRIQISEDTVWYWWEQITLYYTPRFYHTLNHLYNMLVQLPEMEEIDKDKIELAIFFHDIIYDTTRQDNELQSIQMFQVFQNSAGKQYSEVEELIRATIRHTPITNDLNELIFLDLDLSILGSERQVYLQYAQQVRQEYSNYSDEEFYPKRKQVMETFLRRPEIFFTQYFKDKLETISRENIAYEISLIN